MNIEKKEGENVSEFKVIKNLVNLSQEELTIINENIDNNTGNIQLLDLINKINLTEERRAKLKEIQERKLPEVRQKWFNRYNKIVESSKTLDHNLSLLRLNPYTEFENDPYIFFGIGGGSKALCKGLPFDVLTMILTGEKIRKEMGIKKGRILLANRITYTNISRNPEFSEESIDRVMKAEKEIIKLVLRKFKILQYWDVFLQTDIESVIGKHEVKNYEDLIKQGDSSPLVGGHHYAIEMSDIYSLVGKKSGGIKLGWFMRNLDKENGGYIMDEQPFHVRYILFMAKQNICNKVTLAYANAGARLYPGPTGHLEKESPYICYQPENRLLLSPFEKPIEKLKKATLAGGAFQYKYYRKLMNGIIELFEELVLGKNENGTINRINTIGQNDFRGNGIAEKIEFILKYIFDGEDEYKIIWENAFGYLKGKDKNGI